MSTAPEPPEVYEHDYLSTACHHRLHADCRLVCKYCDAWCTCACHLEDDDETRRDRQLLAERRAADTGERFDLDDLTKE